jgi:hypothetical protein
MQQHQDISHHDGQEGINFGLICFPTFANCAERRELSANAMQLKFSRAQFTSIVPDYTFFFATSSCLVYM